MGADWALRRGSRRSDDGVRGPENGAIAGHSEGTGATGLEPATSGVTGRRSNQLSYAPGGDS